MFASYFNVCFFRYLYCRYKSHEEFAADTRLVFDNCETFNEDDSAVGQAGHNLRQFFNVRWAELCEEYS